MISRIGVWTSTFSIFIVALASLMDLPAQRSPRALPEVAPYVLPGPVISYDDGQDPIGQGSW